MEKISDDLMGTCADYVVSADASDWWAISVTNAPENLPVTVVSDAVLQVAPQWVEASWWKIIQRRSIASRGAVHHGLLYV